jgi:heme exporter protein CcmB
MLRAAAWLVWKDLRVELRAKELLYAVVFFAAVVMLIFAFAFVGAERPTVDTIAGILWVTIALSGTVGISRAFEREREGDTLRALLLLPTPRASLYFAKLIGITLLMATVELVAALLLSLLFNISIGAIAAPLAGFLLLGTIGFGAVAALFGASLGKARSRDVLLPLITWPLVVPVLIAGTRGTVALWRDEPSVFWLRFLIVFDAIFVALGALTFEPLTRGDD